MTNRLELNWKLDGFVDEQRYYCSETPMDPLSLPNPKVVLAGDVRSYIDTAITAGLTYYVCVSSVKNGVEKLSEQVVLTASQWSPAQIVITPKIYLDDTSMTEGGWNSKTNTAYNFTAYNTAPVKVSASLSGHAIYRFNGASGLVANLENTKDFAKSKKSVYVFSVVKLNELSNTYKRIFTVTGTNRNAANSKLALFNGNASGDAYWGATESSDRVENSVNYFNSTEVEMVLLNVDYNAGKHSFYKNGLLFNETNIGVSTFPSVASSFAMSIGFYNRTESIFIQDQYTKSDIACLIANDEPITQQDIDKIFGWAAHRYGLTNNLPVDHPYKLIAP